MVSCPVCNEPLHLTPGLPIGKFIYCDWCGEELEVVDINPYQLKMAPEIEDTWGE